MHRLTTIPVLFLCTALVACGGDEGSLEGIYEITSHTRNEQACDAEGPAVADASHFRLASGNFFGVRYLALDDCTAADEESCTNYGFFRAFMKEGGAWVHQITSSSYGGGSCYLGYRYGTIDEAQLAQGVVRIEIRDYSQEDSTLGDEQCSTDEAEQRGADMPCDGYEVLVGTLVE